MENQLLLHIRRFVPLSDEDFSGAASYFEAVHLEKKALLVEAGDLCRYNFFVLKGCLNMFFLQEKGAQQSVQFALENWWMTDYRAFMTQQKTDFFIEAVEPNTKVLRISHEQEEALLARLPILERYFRQVYQIAYGASLIRTRFMFDFSKEDRYHHFSRKYPEFVQRVPQYLLASFLGLTPEYLSEIRRRGRS